MGDRPDPELLEAALRVTRELDRVACVGTLAEAARRLADADCALGYLPAAGGEELACVAAAGGALGEKLRTAFGLLDAGLARRLEGPEVASAGARLGGFDPPDLPPLGPALLAPCRGCGLVIALSRSGSVLAENAAGRVGELIALCEPALSNLAAVEGLRELVVRDDVADCYNRRYLDQALQEELERARRFGGRFALIFLDLDNLKDVNELHGHSVGSRVLAEASVRISRSIRSVDRLCRYGGDEFVVLLPGSDLAGAREVAERMRRELSGSPIEADEGIRVRVTASTGVASWPEHGQSPRELLDAADSAMRRVKTGGKDGIALAEPPPGREGASRD